MMKRSIALILSVLLMLPLFGAVSAEGEAGKAGKAALILAKTGIIPSAALSDEPLTRGGYANILSYLALLPSPSENKPFADVDRGHRYYADIMKVVSTGTMVGRSEFLFAPDDTVTLAEAAKVLVCIMGYGDVALYEGGYPAGYLSVASRIGLLKGVPSGELSKTSAYLLIYNALEIPFAQPEAYGGGAQPLRESDITFLRSYHGLYHLKNALVERNELSGISDNIPCPNNKLVIEGETYGFSGAAEDILPGVRAEVYYYGDDEKEIKYIAPSDTCGILRISKDETDNASSERISYFRGGRSCTANIPVNADILYNGVYTLPSELAQDAWENASYTLIDAENNGTYETVYIDRIESYYTENVNYDGTSFRDAVSERIIDIKSDKNDIYVYMPDGRKTSFDALPTGKLISVSASADGRFTRIWISAASTGGTVTEVDPDGFYIDGEYFKASRNLLQSTKKPNAGDMGTVYFDKNGEAGMFVFKKNSGAEYGYFITANQKKGLTPGYQFKILAASGEMLVLDAAERIKVDGETFKSSDITAYAALMRDYNVKPAADMGRFMPQLIMYSLDKNGDMNYIDTEYMNEKYENDSNLYSHYGKSSAVHTLDEYTGKYFGKFFVDTNDLLVFNVPDDPDVTENKKFNVITDYKMQRSRYSDNRLKPYNEDDVHRTKVLVNYYEVKATDASSRTPLFLVDYVGEYYSEADEETGVKIYGLYDGAHVGYPIEEELYNSKLPQGRTSLKRGDILKITKNTSDEIIALSLVYNIDKRYEFSSNLPYNNNYDTETTDFNGTVYAASNEYFVIYHGWQDNYTDGFFTGDDFYAGKVGWGGFYIYDEEKDEVRNADYSDLKPYKDYGDEASRVYCRFDYGNCAGIVIIKLKH